MKKPCKPLKDASERSHGDRETKTTPECCFCFIGCIVRYISIKYINIWFDEIQNQDGGWIKFQSSVPCYLKKKKVYVPQI